MGGTHQQSPGCTDSVPLLTHEIVTILPEQVDSKLPLKFNYNKTHDVISENSPTPPPVQTEQDKKKTNLLKTREAKCLIKRSLIFLNNNARPLCHLFAFTQSQSFVNSCKETNRPA